MGQEGEEAAQPAPDRTLGHGSGSVEAKVEIQEQFGDKAQLAAAERQAANAGGGAIGTGLELQSIHERTEGKDTSTDEAFKKQQEQQRQEHQKQSSMRNTLKYTPTPPRDG